jgi:hypothetical protein
MRKRPPWHPVRAAALVALAAAACTDARNPAAPEPEGPGGPHGPGGPTVNIQQLACTANLPQKSVSCAPAVPNTGASADVIVGNQGVYVQVTSSNINYDGGTGQFTFDVTLQNLIEQPIGTTDGLNPDPQGIRIFFHSGPTVTGGAGTASVIPDGFATFTAAGQPFYRYSTILDDNEVSAPKTWTLLMPPTVTTFDFLLFVSAPVEYPSGYITLDGQLPGASYGPLHPGSTEELTAVSKDVVGNVVPGTTFAFATADPLCATVGAGTGIVTGVRYATCDVTVSDGARAGSMSFAVTGTTRLWEGDVSASWDDGGNWGGNLVPAVVDSVTIPTGVPNFPALTQNTLIGGVDVADGATLSLGAFTLTASANVATGPTAGSGILGTTGSLVLAGGAAPTGGVRGRVPSLLVTGIYSLSGDLFVVAPETIDAGLLQSDSFEMSIDSQ